jgi:hypothetical protein
MRLLTLLLVTTALIAQNKPAPDKAAETQTAGTQKNDAPVAEIIPVKTLTGDSFDRLVNLLAVFDAKYKGDSQLRTIVVYAPKDVVAQMRRVIEQLDRPGSEAAVGKNIDITLTLLRCSMKPPATAATLPADIEAVARQLRAATQYKDIQLWDAVPMRLQEGKQASENLRLPGVAAAGQFATASITIRPEAVYRKDDGRYVRFARFEIDFRIPIATGQVQPGHPDQPLISTQFTYTNVGLQTSGDFRESQKTVLGKVSGTSDEDAIFVVITLKVLD